MISFDCHLYSKSDMNFSSMKTHYDTYGTFPATFDVLEDLSFFSVISTQEKIRDAWVQVKTKSF